jgi:lipopolysaccharide export system protein LptA
MYLNRLKSISILIVLFISNYSFALPDDNKKVLELAADSADLNQQTHRGEYIGNVQLNQGTSHLRAAKAITEGNEQNKLVLAIAQGNQKQQAHYWTLLAADKPILHAYANTIRYYPFRHLIELIGNARLLQGENSFTAPKICFDTQKQQVISKREGNTRPTIIFHPEKKA